MIVDSSALVSILREESDHELFVRTLLSARGHVRMSAASYVETSIALDKNGDPELANRLDALCNAFEIETVAVTLDQAKIARDAHRTFGRWSDSEAKLNFGDCFVYALCKATGEPLLFKGNDFSQTDIAAAIK